MPLSAIRCSSAATPYLFHHCRPLEHVRFGLVTQHHALQTPFCPGPCPFDDDHYTDLWDLAYAWLAEQFGFWPLFLAVGDDENALYTTGYPDQWRRVTSWAKAGNTYRAKGEFPNDVLFSFAAAPPGIRYSDHDWFTMSVLNAINHAEDHHGLSPISPYERRLVLKPSWTASRWLRAARGDRYTVQACVPALDLRTAAVVWCRSASSRTHLLGLGFLPSQVKVVRLSSAWPQ
jgi:hypothetical protein